MGILPKFIQRRDCRTNHVDQAQFKHSVPGCLQDADLFEGLQSVRQVSRFQVHNCHRYFCGFQRIEHFHLVCDIVQINDFGDGRVESMQCSAGVFRVKSTCQNIVAVEIIQQRA